MTREYTTARAKQLRHPANWIRADHGGDAYLKSLRESYAARPLYPLICIPIDDIPIEGLLEVQDGNLRLEAALRFSPQGGETELPVCILKGEAWTPSTSLEIQMESAAFTKSLSHYEQYLGASQWLTLNPGATAKDLSARIHRHEGTLSKILSLAKGIDKVKDAAKAGLLTYAKWCLICKLPAEKQADALTKALSGATRDELQDQSRKPRTGKAASVQAGSIPLILSNGLAITFRADGLTPSMALAALDEARQELADAIQRKDDARALAARMKKRAKDLTRANAVMKKCALEKARADADA